MTVGFDDKKNSITRLMWLMKIILGTACYNITKKLIYSWTMVIDLFSFYKMSNYNHKYIPIYFET